MGDGCSVSSPYQQWDCLELAADPVDTWGSEPAESFALTKSKYGDLQGAKNMG